MEKKLTDSGAKAYQISDTEYRIKQYSDWHRTLDRNLRMIYVDFIEWCFKNGQLVPVGVMEVTLENVGKEVGPGYLNAIISHYEKRDIQARATIHSVEALKTKAYIVSFWESCTESWVNNLSDKRGWWLCTQQKM